MSKHIDTMRRAIEYRSPRYIPMELVDVPLLYDAYGTLDPSRTHVPEGAEDFDSAWCTYHWTFDYEGCTAAGEPVRKDEWGCTQVVPADAGTAYTVTGKPELTSLDAVAAHPWPDPSTADPFFERRRRVVEQHYRDRFICGFIDPGPFLVAFNLLGYDRLLMALHDDIDLVKAVLRRVVDYQKALVPKFAAMGVHMVNIIDEIAGSQGLMFAPDLFREHFRVFFDELLAEIHRHNMYTSLLLDGNITQVLPDVMAMDLDQMFFAQPLSTGFDTIADACRGKRCVKMAVDMMVTLAEGTPDAIRAEVERVADTFALPEGGLVFQALRWHRPEYAPERVRAQIDAMNRYRAGTT